MGVCSRVGWDPSSRPHIEQTVDGPEGFLEAAQATVVACLPHARPFQWPPGLSQGSVARPQPGQWRSTRKWSPPLVPFPGDPVLGDWGGLRSGVPRGQVLGNLRQVAEHSEPPPHNGGQEGGVGDRKKPPVQLRVKEPSLPSLSLSDGITRAPWSELARPDAASSGRIHTDPEAFSTSEVACPPEHCPGWGLAQVS